MKPKTFSIYLLTMIVLFACQWGNAQEEEEQTPLYDFVWNDTVLPGHEESYLKVVKEEQALFQANGWNLPIYTYRDSYEFFYVTPLNSLEEFVKFDKNVKEIIQTIGDDKVNQLFGKYSNKISHFDTRFWERNEDLSYTPDNAVYTPDITTPFYMFVQHWYIKPGKEAELSDIIKKLHSILDEKEFNYTIYASFLYFGENGPILMAAIPAESEEKFKETNAKDWHNLGSDYHKLYNQALQLCRKIEYQNLTYVPELSFHPEQD